MKNDVSSLERIEIRNKGIDKVRFRQTVVKNKKESIDGYRTRRFSYSKWHERKLLGFAPKKPTKRRTGMRIVDVNDGWSSRRSLQREDFESSSITVCELRWKHQWSRWWLPIIFSHSVKKPEGDGPRNPRGVNWKNIFSINMTLVISSFSFPLLFLSSSSSSSFSFFLYNGTDWFSKHLPCVMERDRKRR